MQQSASSFKNGENMKIRLRTNLIAGIVAIIAGIIVWLLIPAQIGKDYAATYGVTSKTIPYGVAILWFVCGAGLIVQSVFFKKENIVELQVTRELKALLYMLVLVAYIFMFQYSFIIATSVLGVVTLAFTGTKKWFYYVIVIAMVVLLYFLFTQVLHVQLP